jgi:hypothetical protein
MTENANAVMVSDIQVTHIGFDLRLALGVANPDWTADRRNRYLMEPQVSCPLSVDPAVWPRALPTSGDGPLGLWLDLSRFEAEHAAEAGTRIAIGVAFQTVDADIQHYLASSVAPCRPLTPEVSWPFLGYDVADSALISGLSNCGFVPGIDDSAALRAKWASRLNDHGLFVEWTQATAFRKEIGIRLPEHAPFFVFGLWLIGSEGSQ